VEVIKGNIPNSSSGAGEDLEIPLLVDYHFPSYPKKINPILL